MRCEECGVRHEGCNFVGLRGVRGEGLGVRGEGRGVRSEGVRGEGVRNERDSIQILLS